MFPNPHTLNHTWQHPAHPLDIDAEDTQPWQTAHLIRDTGVLPKQAKLGHANRDDAIGSLDSGCLDYDGVGGNKIFIAPTRDDKEGESWCGQSDIDCLCRRWPLVGVRNAAHTFPPTSRECGVFITMPTIGDVALLSTGFLSVM